MAALAPHESASRWINVIFLQGDDADEVLGMIDRNGPVRTIEYLKRWDYGDETTDAALANGYVYDSIPAGPTDPTFDDTGSPYALTYSAPHGYVSLLRQYSAEVEVDIAPAPRVSSTHVARARESVNSWEVAQHRSKNAAAHAVAL